MNTIDPKVKGTLTKYLEVKRLWDHLKVRFATFDGPRIQQLRSDIANCHQTKTMTVSSYYGKLNSLWAELYKHVSSISFHCCTQSTAGLQHQERREYEK